MMGLGKGNSLKKNGNFCDFLLDFWGVNQIFQCDSAAVTGLNPRSGRRSPKTFDFGSQKTIPKVTKESPVFF